MAGETAGNASGYIPVAPPFSLETFNIIDVSIRGAGFFSVSLFGLVSNIINMIVFCRQGFMSHSTNVSFTFMSLSDLVYCCLNIFGAVLTLFETYIDTDHWSWEVWHFDFFFVGVSMVTFVQVTCWITAYIAIERAVCVVFPFVAKSIFSSKVALVSNVSIYIVVLFLHAPCLLGHVPKWAPHAYLANKSQLVYLHGPIPYNIIIACYEARDPCVLAAILVVVLCNAVIVWKVKLSSKFRKRNSAAAATTVSKTDECRAEKSDSSTFRNKDVKLMRMVLAISALFVVCYVCQIPHQLMANYVWDPEETQVHVWVIYVLYDAVTFVQCLNSTVNIIVYYKMSSRYRKEFHSLFKRISNEK